MKPQLEKILEQIDKLDAVEREVLAFELEMMPPFGLWGHRWHYRHHVDAYPSIVSTPNVCGGAARMIRTRIPVWTLERMRQLGVSEAEILRSFPRLQALDLVQAWSYVAHHREEIEAAIRENESNEE